jgi:integrin alpha 8
VVYGDFCERHAGTEFAVGTPKAYSNLTGKVSIMNRRFEVLLELAGEQTGAYFAYSLASLDVNGDGRADLIVSAPLYSNYDVSYDHWEVGRVYVYRQTNDSRLSLQTTLDGDTCRGRFGVSLTSLGDVNRDTYEDLAVGAPYAGPSGNGLVYVYNGAADGLSSLPSQVIAPEQLPFAGPPLRTFGWSLAGGTDLNNDDYPDLAIGAYGSDAAVFLRARPLLDTKVKFDVQPANVSLEQPSCSKIDGTQVPCVTISVCLAYNAHRAVPNKLRFMWNVHLDVGNNRTFPRMYVVNMNNDRMHVHRGVLALERGRLGQCSKFKAYVEEHAQDYVHPIVLRLDYAIQNYHSLAAGSRVHTPMLNPAPNRQLHTQVRIQHDCGVDNVCIPNLKVDVTK